MSIVRDLSHGIRGPDTMSNEVKRYWCSPDNLMSANPEEAPDGGCVKYADHQAALTERDRKHGEELDALHDEIHDLRKSVIQAERRERRKWREKVEGLEAELRGTRWALNEALNHAEDMDPATEKACSDWLWNPPAPELLEDK